jgi:hypothetical protein
MIGKAHAWVGDNLKMQGQSQLLPRLRPLILRIPHPRALPYTKTFRKPELVGSSKIKYQPNIG